MIQMRDKMSDVELYDLECVLAEEEYLEAENFQHLAKSFRFYSFN